MLCMLRLVRQVIAGFSELSRIGYVCASKTQEVLVKTAETREGCLPRSTCKATAAEPQA